MSMLVTIAGAASRIGLADGEAMEHAVREAVRVALAAAGMSLDDIDTVVTVGSDILDGGMVAMRSGIAGSYGRSLLTIPSSAGHALAASVAMIESGAAQNILLVGWGEGTKFDRCDGRTIQADPFYARPVGGDAAALALLQAQRVLASSSLDPVMAENYSGAMRSRAGGSETDAGRAGVSGWLTPNWCDGACALVLAPAAVSGPAIAIRDFGISFQPYCPAPEDLDPASWVHAAIASMRDRDSLAGLQLAVIEAAGPTAFCEIAALDALLAERRWASTDPRVNPSGGGSVACFGPATGLRGIVAAADLLRRQAPFAVPTGGVAIDLAGPIGQATTVVVLEARAMSQ